MLGETKKG
ncbi:hypothetical protein YPPY102_3878, partial [Yersinia pestis PY-102]